MPQSLSRVVVHGIYSVKGRAPGLDSDLRAELFPYLASVLKSEGHQPIKIGGHVDHVHMLFGLSRTVTIAKAIETSKVSSTKWIKQTNELRHNFAWQGGYATFGVSESDIDQVVRYIASQDVHHQKISFQDELRSLLQEHGIDYDEKYLCD